MSTVASFEENRVKGITRVHLGRGPDLGRKSERVHGQEDAGAIVRREIPLYLNLRNCVKNPFSLSYGARPCGVWIPMTEVLPAVVCKSMTSVYDAFA